MRYFSLTTLTLFFYWNMLPAQQPVILHEAGDQAVVAFKGDTLVYTVEHGEIDIFKGVDRDRFFVRQNQKILPFAGDTYVVSGLRSPIYTMPEFFVYVSSSGRHRMSYFDSRKSKLHSVSFERSCSTSFDFTGIGGAFRWKRHWQISAELEGEYFRGKVKPYLLLRKHIIRDKGQCPNTRMYIKNGRPVKKRTACRRRVFFLS